MYLEYTICYLKSIQWIGRLPAEFCACIRNRFCYPYFCLQEQHHQLAQRKTEVWKQTNLKKEIMWKYYMFLKYLFNAGMNQKTLLISG